MPAYEFKTVPELGWAVLVAVVAVAAQLVNTADPQAVLTDPRTFLVALGAAMVRAALGALLDAMKPAAPAAKG